MSELPLLSLVIFLPLVGCLFILFISGDDKFEQHKANLVALLISGATFFISLVLWIQFDADYEGFQFIEKYDWIPSYKFYYHIGIDGISLSLVLLTTFLTPLIFLFISQERVPRYRQFLILFLMLETFVIGAFCANDILLFYLFFEGSLIPLFLIIGIWGGERRFYAAYKFFLYTFFGSIFMFMAFVVIYNQVGSGDFDLILKSQFMDTTQKWLWLAFFISFAIKLPLWPFHTWLPDAHVEAPTSGSVVLAGVLLKLAGYGFLRFSLPLFPDACLYFQPLVMSLSLIGLVYTSCVAFAQTNLKKRIAYSSIAHMGFVTLGIFSFSSTGIKGAIFQMISHGLLSAGLFWTVGLLTKRTQTKDMDSFGGIVQVMPKFAVVFMILTLGAISLPLTSGFVGEIMILLSLFPINGPYLFIAVSCVLLSACYMLQMYKQVVFGPLEKEALRELKDLTLQEKGVLYPLAGLVLLGGIYPKPIFDLVSQPVKKIETQYIKAAYSKDVKSV